MPSCILNFKNDGRTEQRKLLLLDADMIIVQSPLFWYSMSSLIMRWWEETFAHGWAYGSIGEALKGKKIIWYYCWWHPTELYASGVAGIMGEQIPNRFEVYAKFCQMDYLGGKLTGGC